jgi:hypothetical protein
VPTSGAGHGQRVCPAQKPGARACSRVRVSVKHNKHLWGLSLAVAVRRDVNMRRILRHHRPPGLGTRMTATRVPIFRRASCGPVRSCVSSVCTGTRWPTVQFARPYHWTSVIQRRRPCPTAKAGIGTQFTSIVSGKGACLRPGLVVAGQLLAVG